MSARVAVGVVAALLAAASVAGAHNGPPYPIVSDRLAGPYLVSIWTDQDTTDDNSTGGQFWVRVAEVEPKEDFTVTCAKPGYKPRVFTFSLDQMPCPFRLSRSGGD